MRTNGENYQPSSILVHNLINRLSVIVGRCDLMMEDVGDDEPESYERLQVLQNLAKSMARELIEDRSEREHVRSSSVRV